MSTTPLDTNFKDDILASSNAKRKYQMTYNDDGTVSFQDVTAYSQMGSAFGAKEVNEERAAINKINSDRIVALDEIDLVTEPGFFVDAMAVKELNRKLPELVVASSSTISYTPDRDCKVLVTYEVCGWGFGGTTWQIEITGSASSGDSPIRADMKRGVFDGTDGIYKDVSTSAYFIGLRAGVTYTFNRVSYAGSGGKEANPFMKLLAV